MNGLEPLRNHNYSYSSMGIEGSGEQNREPSFPPKTNPSEYSLETQDFAKFLRTHLSAKKDVVIEGLQAGAAKLVGSMIDGVDGEPSVLVYQQPVEKTEFDRDSLSRFLEENAHGQKNFVLVVKVPDSTIKNDKSLSAFLTGCKSRLVGESQVVLLREDPLGFEGGQHALHRMSEAEGPVFDSLIRSQILASYENVLGYDHLLTTALSHQIQRVRTEDLDYVLETLVGDGTQPIEMSGMQKRIADLLDLKKDLESFGSYFSDGSEESTFIATPLNEIAQLPSEIEKFLTTVRNIKTIEEHLPNTSPYTFNLLMAGPPGTGKTITAKAIAAELDAHFISPKASDIKSKWVNEDIGKMEKIFEEAQYYAEGDPDEGLEPRNVVLFFDEIDSYAGRREANKGTTAGQHETQAVNNLLQAMESLNNNDSSAGKILFLGATNLLESLDDAVASRFGTKAFFAELTPDSIKEILGHQVKKVKNCSITDEQLSRLVIPENIAQDARMISQVNTKMVLASIERRNDDPFEGPHVTIEDLETALSELSLSGPRIVKEEISDSVKHIYT